MIIRSKIYAFMLTVAMAGNMATYVAAADNLATGIVDLPQLPTRTVRLSSGITYSDINRTYTDNISLLGQLISSVLSTDGVDRVYTYNEEGWVSENVYGTFDSSDSETPEVTFTFTEDGSLSEIFSKEYRQTYSYAKPGEYPGAVYKVSDDTEDSFYTIMYYNADMVPIARIQYRRNEATGNYDESVFDDYCISGKELHYEVYLSGKDKKYCEDYNCCTEMDAEGNLIRETHSVINTYYSDGTSVNFDGHEYVNEEYVWEYENGKPVKEVKYSYNDNDAYNDDFDQISLVGKEYHFDESGRLVSENEFKAVADAATREVDPKSVVYKEKSDEIQFTDVTVLDDPLLIAYLQMTTGYPILAVDEMPEVEGVDFSVEDADTETDGMEADETDLSCLIGEIKAGDVITFGQYNVDGNWDNGKEPLEWIVLSSKNHQVLLMTKETLNQMEFDEAGKGPVTWETCTLRTYLNQDFIEGAFTEREAACLEERLNSQRYKFANLSSIDVGNPTTDRVFLLSYEEFKQYVVDGSEIAAAGSEWWLRSMNTDNVNVETVRIDGTVGNRGLRMTNKASIRPCILLNLPDSASTPDENGVYYEPLDTITFGSFEQDNNESNGVEPIEWEVLGFFPESGYLVVTSKNVLDWKIYDSDRNKRDFSSSEIRQYLNNEFFEAAFTEEEKAVIYTADLGDDGINRVFLLGEGAFHNYSSRLIFRQTTATPYAVANGAPEESGADYWLRSVESGHPWPYYCQFNGELTRGKRTNSECGVRPCIELDIEALGAYFG